jgi:hypothetical protein
MGQTEAWDNKATEASSLGHRTQASTSSVISVKTPLVSATPKSEDVPTQISLLTSPSFDSAQEASYASLQRALNAAIAGREQFNHRVEDHFATIPATDRSPVYVSNALPKNSGNQASASAFSDWGSSAASSVVWTPSQGSDDLSDFSGLSIAHHSSQNRSPHDIQSDALHQPSFNLAFAEFSFATDPNRFYETLNQQPPVQAAANEPQTSYAAEHTLLSQPLQAPFYPKSRRGSCSEELADSLGNFALNPVSQAIPVLTQSQNGVFKRPDAHIDIAARRKRPRPAALGTAALRSRSYGGPRNVKDVTFLVWNYPSTTPVVKPSDMSLKRTGISPALPNTASRMTETGSETGSESKHRPVARLLSPESAENEYVRWNSGAVTEIENPHASSLPLHKFTSPSPPIDSSPSKLGDELIRGIEGLEFSQTSDENITPDDQRYLETGSVDHQEQNAPNLLTHPESNDSVYIASEVITNPQLSMAGSCAIVDDIGQTSRTNSSDCAAADADLGEKLLMDNIPETITNEVHEVLIPTTLSNGRHMVENSIPADDEIDENDTTSETYSGESDETRSNSSYYRDLCDRTADNSNSTPNFLSPILDPARQALVDRVMKEFWVVFDRELDTGFRVCAGISGSSGRSGNPSASDSNANATSPLSQRKRQREDGECPEENDDRNRRPPRRRAGPSSIPGDSTRFACPFRKHNPRRYSIHDYRVCALSHWETIARVKYAPNI